MKQQPPPPGYLSRNETAALLGVTPQTVRHWQGYHLKRPLVGRGRQKFYEEADVRALIEKGVPR